MNAVDRRVCVVYILYDARVDPLCVRYVGKTINRMQDRISAHLQASRDAAKYQIDKPFYGWVRDLGRENLAWKVIDGDPDPIMLLEKEMYWIHHFTTVEPQPLYNIMRMPTSAYRKRGRDK